MCGMVAAKDYGTATHEEIMAGMNVAIAIGKMIRAIDNPAVRHMVKEMIALIQCGAGKE